MRKTILTPPSNIGIVGGGQLGRMMSFCAKRMGYRVTILDPTADCPAAQVSDECITASFSDAEALKKLSHICDVLTYEFEHIDADLLIDLEEQGSRVIPSGRTLKIIQNKFDQKTLLKAAGLPVPEFRKVETKEDIVTAIEKFGLPIVLKTSKGGYDGKGNFVIKSIYQIETALEKLSGGELMVEQYINFSKELSTIVAKDLNDNIKVFPVVENIHEENILRFTKAPAAVEYSVSKKIIELSEQVINALGDIGLFCIEYFVTTEGEVYINELAPRPHNSGHYTIEACATSQYEQLIRIVTGLPLGSTKLNYCSVMANILGSDDVKGPYTVDGLESITKEDKVYFHLYGKKNTDTLKKIGHITVCRETVEEAENAAVNAINNLKIKAL
jgi:5-(carboxyamino)imidazole ribonucleotide synthase